MLFGDIEAEMPNGLVVAKNPEITLEPCGEVVLGFPALLNVHMRMSGLAGHTNTMLDIFDLAGSVRPSSGMLVFAVHEDGEQYHVSRVPADNYVPSGSYPYSLGVLTCPSDTTLSLWMDLYHTISMPGAVWIRSGYPDDRPPRPGLEELLRPGCSKLIVAIDVAASDVPATVCVRRPNQAEQQFLAAIGYDKAISSWFPWLVLSDEPLPSAEGLPLSTRRIVRVVEILRAAWRSEEEGLALLRTYASEQWGALGDLVDQLEYEMLVDLGREDAAAGVAARLEPGNVLQIRDKKGLLAAYRTLAFPLMRRWAEFNAGKRPEYRVLTQGPDAVTDWSTGSPVLKKNPGRGGS